MRPLILSIVLMLSLPAWAQAPYTPKFARVAESAAVLSWDLCPKPVYPRSSLRNEETGVVTLGFTVAPNGRLLAASVVRSSGFRDLDNAAYAAFSQCRFRPASIDGVPVQTRTQVQYVWRLQ